MAFEFAEEKIVENQNEKVNDAKYCISMVPNEENANVNGSVHGGVLFLLCDEAIGRYVTSLERKGAAADANIHFYRPAKIGERIYATVRERKVGRKLGVYLVEITGPDGKLLADSLFTVAFSE